MADKKLVMGVGKNTERVKFNGVHTKEYLLWRSMLFRCYNDKNMKKNDCYKICHVAEEWLDFTTFKNDIREMVGFNRDGWHLDKDILKKGNNVYSKDTCCFVPKEINTMLTYRKTGTNPNFVGVTKIFCNSFVRYKVMSRDGGKSVYLGRFTSETEARNAYVLFKKSVISKIAEKYKAEIDTAVYNALINFEI